MSMTVKELKQWLDTLPDDWSVGIDDGGMILQSVEDPDVYYEIGGIPEEDEPKAPANAAR